MTLSLQYQRDIVQEIINDDGLLILARGLGLRKLVCTLLKIYDDPRNLVLVVNLSSKDEQGFAQELAMLGVKLPGMTFIHNEKPQKERADIYQRGGILCVTSRILVVDMLTKTLPIHLITGIIVMRAERISLTTNEAFLLRLYRDENTDGFIKAFSDNPEAFATGFAPLQTTLKVLHLRKVYIWPRFRDTVSSSLQSNSVQVIELHQELSDAQRAIQQGIIECMDICLAELRRSNANIEIEDFTVENALFRSFDAIIRRQLDPIWHRVNFKTRQLVGDMKDLRDLLNYLVSYDCVTFNYFLETILMSNTKTGDMNQTQSPWLLTEAADTIFKLARSRVYIKEIFAPSKTLDVDQDGIPEPLEEEPNDDDELEIINNPNKGIKGIPPGYTPVLEEQPKWGLLDNVLKEVEREIQLNPLPAKSPGNNTILIMTEMQRTCGQINEYLASEPVNGSRGHKMLIRLLREYFRRKSEYAKVSQNLFKNDVTKRHQEAMKQKEGIGFKHPFRRGQPPSKRRRVRGGSVTVSSARNGATNSTALETESEELAKYLEREEVEAQDEDIDNGESTHEMTITNEFDESAFEDYFALLKLDELVIIRPYSGDDDDQVLGDLKPRFVIMYDLDMSFVRRLEAYRSSNPGIGLRVYFLIYSGSVEEQKYLASMRKEKDAFESLIRERATMALPLHLSNKKAKESENEFMRIINTRVAGGGRLEATDEPPRVVVDMREFRSPLPSLLHEKAIQVIPCTLNVGDYVLTPEICVERKSIPDLISSFNSGRLYTQCETMSLHYKQPILLIEFDHNKSFALNTNANTDLKVEASMTDLSSKLVLLTLAFPRVKTIWSSSPYQTADIFADIKSSYQEPDPIKAAQIGSPNDDEVASTYNVVAQELLQTLPGINMKNYRYVMTKVESLRTLSELPLKNIQDIVGNEPGRALYEFFRRDAKSV